MQSSGSLSWPALAWYDDGNPDSRDVYATTGFGGSAVPSTLRIEAITDGLDFATSEEWRGLAVGTLSGAASTISPGQMVAQADALKASVLAKSRYYKNVPSGASSPPILLLIDLLADAYGCYNGRTGKYIPLVLVDQVMGGEKVGAEYFKTLSKYNPGLVPTDKSLNEAFKRAADEIGGSIKNRILAFFEGTPAEMQKWCDRVIDRVKTFLAAVPADTMGILADYCWGLGLGATQRPTSEKRARWSTGIEDGVKEGIDGFIDYVSKTLNKPAVFENTAIKEKLSRLLSFIKTGVLDGVVYEKRYGVWPIPADGADYSPFMHQIYKEFSNFVKDVIVELGLLSRESLERFVPSHMVEARRGLSRKLGALKSTGWDQFVAALVAAMRGLRIYYPGGRLDFEYFLASFFPEDPGDVFKFDLRKDMDVFLKTFSSSTYQSTVTSKGVYYQRWEIEGNHWRMSDDGARIYFEIKAQETGDRIVCYIDLDENGHARPLADGFIAFVDANGYPSVPSVRWDQSAPGATLPSLIRPDGGVNNLAGFRPEVSVDPSTWTCLSVLINGWD